MSGQAGNDAATLALGVWTAAVQRPLLPTGWPVAAGLPAPGTVCGVCRRRGWWQRDAWWLCATCAPPLFSTAEVWV